jgi:hypothetical protein
MDTNNDSDEPAATSVATSTISNSTPGAVHVDASSMKSQPAFQQKKNLIVGPSFYPEDHQQLQLLPSSLEQNESFSAGGKAHSGKSEDKLKQYGEATKKINSNTDSDYYTTDVKRSAARSDRQENRRDRIILSRSAQENVMPPSAVSLTRKAPARGDVTPGAVQVSGINSMSSTYNDQMDGRTTTMLAEEDSSSQALHNNGETDGEESTRMIIEAQLVVEEDTERLGQTEREQIEEETRQQLIGEMGKVAQAEVVEDAGSKTRRRALLCAGIMVILLAIILGVALGTRRDTSPSANTISVSATTAPTISFAPSETPSLRPSASPSMKPSQAPTFAPLNNNLCEEAHPIILGGSAIVASLENATQQLFISCLVYNPIFLANLNPGSGTR